MDIDTPDLAGLRAAVSRFAAYGSPDRSWAALLRKTEPRLDPALAEHRAALLAWLNAWGCRIRYPRPGEPDVFDAGLADWWGRFGGRLPAAEVSMAELTDQDIDRLGECFAELSAMPAAALAKGVRPLGPTAAAKLFHAFRPRAVMPWDEAIAVGLHGARGGAAFAAHQRLGRTWARALLAEAGLDESGLAEQLGRPGRPLAKMLDDYCYLVLTRDEVMARDEALSG
ncbi:hypothetical protein [Streptacidiphilus sp. EB129]|uniref:hypothetical protein n=1 Tax=Streptacidiphilus sp. EB129 TaxID=3156262 RepID=UPI003518AC79